MKITVLGCGSSMGTPAAGGFWGRCDPAERRNHRTRAALLVQSEKTNIVVDAGYDFRQHLNTHNVKDLDALLITHAHSDHVNGLDDIRAIAYHHNRLVDLYADRETIEEVRRRWPYLFDADKIYMPCLKPREVTPYDGFTVGEIAVKTFEQDHHVCKSLGYRFGDFAYSADVADLDAKALAALHGVETWVVDAGGYRSDAVKQHANLKRVLEWTEILKPRMTYLTVLTTLMDYKTLCEELPPHVRPAYDGLEIEPGTNRQ
jgi:phosphoribosyl 1,2-cyclic phosphate phosphodiesterase